VSAATSSVQPARCPRCDAESDGAAWCAECGLNLRHTVLAPVADAVPPLPETPRSHRRLIAACAALAVAIAVATAVVLFTRGSGSNEAPAPAPAPAAAPSAPVKEPAPLPTAPRVRAITPVEMSGVLQAYVNAYSSEDTIGLRSLFADDLVRTNGSDAPENLAQALDTYRLQFAGLSNPLYRLSGVSYDAVRATAAGIYSISSDSGTVGGSIRFHFVRVGTGLLIDAISIQPSS
jgi:hypothetical protein